MRQSAWQRAAKENAASPERHAAVALFSTRRQAAQHRICRVQRPRPRILTLRSRVALPDRLRNSAKSQDLFVMVTLLMVVPALGGH